MRIGKWVLGIAALALLFCGTVNAQVTDDFNRICMHNGGDYYVNPTWGPTQRGTPNMGTGHFTPSYAHVPARQAPNGFYDWKIRGWSWIYMKAPGTVSNQWLLLSTMQAIFADHYNFFAVSTLARSCTFPAVLGYCPAPNGVSLPTIGFQDPIYRWGGAGLASSLPYVGGKDLLFPSSSSWTSAANIFAIGAGSINVPSTAPWYGYGFGFIYTVGSASDGIVTIPSAASIWQWSWDDMNPGFQYCIFSGNELENSANYPANSADPTTLEPGLKAKNFMFGYTPPYIYGWWCWQGAAYGQPGKGGGDMNTEMCLFVDDAVCIPANYGIGGVAPHAANNPGNPYYMYGFDVGTATLSPVVSEGAAAGGGNPKLVSLLEAHDLPGVVVGTLFSRNGGTAAYANGGGYRLPVAYPDSFMNTALKFLFNWSYATSNGGFPVCGWYNPAGCHGGFNTLNVGSKYHGFLPCKEMHMCTFGDGISPSASYMACFK